MSSWDKKQNSEPDDETRVNVAPNSTNAFVVRSNMIVQIPAVKQHLSDLNIYIFKYFSISSKEIVLCRTFPSLLKLI